ncbi:MAG TPA: ATP-binding protein [Thermoanaerobaculia bacterium]|nr:ATP-binding protein [Thermoanaerobaculia bacterium]
MEHLFDNDQEAGSLRDTPGLEAEVQRLNRLLEERRVELDALMNVLPVGIAVAHDPECRMITVNPGFTDLVGLPPGSNISKSAEDGGVLPYRILRNGKDVPVEELPMQMAASSGVPVPAAEVDVELADGRIFHLLVTAAPLFDEQGKTRGCIGAHFDITERKEAEEKLRQAKEAAEAANQAKDRFLATLSHELRTPLTPVLAVVSSLERDERLDELVREELAMIRRNIELEARLIDDLLDLTRITRGKIELHSEVIDLRQVLDHALQTCCSPELAARCPRIVTDLAEGDHRVWGDASRLTQVLWNLLSNAVKFTPAEGTITVRSRREPGEDGGWLRIEIRDDGIGIEPDVLPRLFEGFEQGERSITRQFGGLGLGLAISKAIAEMHGGSLAAASEGRGRGATFTLKLPDRGDLAVKEADHAAEAGGTDGAGRSLHLLLVEDHADTAEAMADLLRLLGHRVDVAGTVAAALDTAQGSAGDPFDLVVSDLGLPDGTGLDLMRELTRRHGLRGIALSGYGMEEDIRKSREAGFARHLTKPVNLQALESAIRQAAALSR